MIDIKGKPFYLDEEGIEWVKKTLAGMRVEEKIGQLFCLTDITMDPAVLTEMVRKYRPGAYLTRAGDAEEVKAALAAMQETSPIPMLFPCNLESGGNGIASQGTFFARPMAVAATGDDENARRLGLVCAREAGALGCNWALAPIVDIDYNWRNPITNVRTFGADPDTVLSMAEAYMEGVRTSGIPMAVCLKHFPGDGVDERDQHLLPTVNDLPFDVWMETYGWIYRKLIEKGAQTVMAGHIYQPALEQSSDPDIRRADMLPASQSRALLTGILRERFGFNGLIVTDATPMVGYNVAQRRADALRTSIAAGADMLMFCKNIEEDFAAIRQGLESGAISRERVDNAVMRQLALKASLSLHKARDSRMDISAVGCEEHKLWSSECADRSVTLVRDRLQILPISPQKTPHIRLTVLGEGEDGGFGDGSSVGALFREALEQEGFRVSMYDRGTMEHGEIFTSGVADMQAKFDLSIVAANVSTSSNHTTRRLDWIPLMAADEPWYTKDIPTVFVSFCNPYHLFDVPFMDCFINAYSSNPAAVKTVTKKLLGWSAFYGISPVDSFCGRKDLE
ncbi:MAG: glycoside hydrolase family 3 protein [Oscillospiraceae bacterium]|nr:glycoside hydrolase family 3 protein [Oscillospiraceae bacterium]